MSLWINGEEAALAKPKQSLANLIREMGKDRMSIEQIADAILPEGIQSTRIDDQPDPCEW